MKYLMFLSLVGNMTLCELAMWRPERPVWVIIQLSRTATPHASWEHRGMTREPAHYNTIEKKKQQLYPTVSVHWSSTKLFSISACWFSVLVYRIISSKCNHNLKPQWFGHEEIWKSSLLSLVSGSHCRTPPICICVVSIRVVQTTSFLYASQWCNVIQNLPTQLQQPPDHRKFQCLWRWTQNANVNIRLNSEANKDILLERCSLGAWVEQYTLSEVKFICTCNYPVGFIGPRKLRFLI